MSPLAIVVLFVAFVVTAVRGPLAVAPEASVERLRRWFFASDTRFRRVGVGMVVLMAAPLILAARITPPAHQSVVWFEALGWLIGLGAAFVILLPGPLRRWIEGILDGMPTPALRFVGVVNIAFSLFLVWVAFAFL
ncbi:MAG: hypothetical protein HKN73_11980 [Gemmatimonadetes bacterium]|nr:hypothetical protein [Gemmatimonadota bacterium]